VTASFDDELVPVAVFLDGESIGTTPLQKPGLRPGRHVVEVRHPKYKNKRRVIMLTPGKTKRVPFVMER
jgi:hypothetical protein